MSSTPIIPAAPVSHSIGPAPVAGPGELIHERLLSSLGLGSFSTRFFVIFGAAAAVEYMLKPNYAFDSKGNARSLAMIDPSPGSTSIPILLFPLILAGSACFFL